jgi:alpha-1,6-mannosyltransferase
VLISSIRFRVNLLGAIALLAYASLALLSYAQTPALWRDRDTPRVIAFFDALIAQFPVIGLNRLLENNTAVLVSYCVPLALATSAAVLLLILLTRHKSELNASLVTLLLRWSLAFTAACLFSYPLFTQDFWLSAAWGRMVAAGTNPYHVLFTTETITELPLDHFPMAMSYGPGWALLSGAVMTLAGQSVLATAILFKLILAAAWVGALVLVEKITEPRPIIDRCLAVALLGWVPLGVTQTVAEGHNDIFMAVLALLWMLLALRDRWTAPFALVASILSKFTTLPLMLVDAIAMWRMHGLSSSQLVLRYVSPGLFGLGAFAAFYRSPEFFDGMRIISEWQFLQPRDAVAAVQLAFGISLFPAEYLIAAGCAGFAIYWLAAFFKEPEPDNLAKATLAVMCAVSFAAIAHLWPWYVVWILPLAAVLPSWWLSRFVVGLSILAPFTLVFWWVELFPHALEWAAVALYIGALLWTVLTRSATALGGQSYAA